jgi:hypothetical protein
VTPAVLDRPASLLAERGPAAAPDAERPVGGERAAGPVGGGRVTLEERLSSILREVRTNGSTECPVCHARMGPAGSGAASAGAAPDAAECGGCGSRLT